MAAWREPTLRELRRYLDSGSLSTLSRNRRRADTRISEHCKEPDARVKREELISGKMQQDTALLKQRADSAEAERTEIILRMDSALAHQSSQNV